MKKQRTSILQLLVGRDESYLFDFLKSQTLEELKVLAEEFYRKGKIEEFKDNKEVILAILKQMDYFLNLGQVFDGGRIYCLEKQYR